VIRIGCAGLTILAAAFVGIHFHAPVASEERSATGEVNVINRSHPTACAEEDNVDLELVSKTITGFTVRVSHPSYIQNITSQRSRSDFHNCSFGNGTSAGNAENRAPQKIIFYQSPEIRLVGLKFASFWRRPVVPVIVDGHRELGAQLIQLWVRSGDSEEEVLAFYPPDGYWRFRPLPYGKLRLTAYGSSVLFGPVERGGGRPYVGIKQVVFDPPSRSFRLDFDAGGSATVKLLAIDDHACTISVSFAGPLPRDLPFAAVRSMFMDEGHADVARIAWAKDQPAELVSAFHGGMVSRLWMGRLVESRHNNTAPDHLFSDFILREPVNKVANEHGSSHQIGT
jgi:hypothetical protein